MQTSISARLTARASVAAVGQAKQSTTTGYMPWRYLLVVGSVLAVAVPAVWADSAVPIPMAADLTRLLRMMAVLKAGVAIVAMGVVWWRFQFPTQPRFALAYVASSWLMAAGSAVMWQLTHLIAGAVVFHVGLALVLLSAWRDNRTERIG